MEFYSYARTDDLARRIVKPFEMTETFDERTDFLFHRHVVYGKSVKESPGALEQRPIQVKLSHDKQALTFKPLKRST